MDFISIALGSITTAIAVYNRKIKPNPTSDPVIEKKNEKVRKVIKAFKVASAAITEALVEDEA